MNQASERYWHPFRVAPERSVGWLAFTLLVAACLTGCSSSETPRTYSDEPNVPPSNYRAEILAFLRTYLNDPTNIRSASISEPALKPAGSGTRYAVCLRFNAKKTGSGEYEGSKDRIVYFLMGKLDTMIEARRGECNGAVYQPFSELEHLTR